MPGWVVGCALLGLGGLFCVANWMAMIQSIRTRRHISMVPLAGPLALAGCALVPAIGWRIGLVVLALDPMTWSLISLPGYLVWQWFRDRPRG